jgi:hypothetical protein
MRRTLIPGTAQVRRPIIVVGLLVVLLFAVVAATRASSLTGSRSRSTGSATTSKPHGLPIPTLPPASQFVRRIDNPYLPLQPGRTWVYAGSESSDGERDVVRVLDRTKLIQGIRATVVLDVTTSHGRLIEHTFDWYAQDKKGNVWYLGEDTKAYEDGHVSTEGSWQLGVAGARAGIAMLAHPRSGDSYRQEYLKDTAEDVGKVLDTSINLAGLLGQYHHVVMTKDTSALEPDVTEVKFYARGVGSVLEMDIGPDRGASDLVSVG